MSETLFIFEGAAASNFKQHYSSNDKGYKIKSSLNFDANFTPELAELLRCRGNFFDDEGNWRDGISTAGVPVVMETATIELYEIAAAKKAEPVHLIKEATVASISVFDEKGTPRITFTVAFPAGGSAWTKFVEKRQYYHGTVHIAVEQANLDFGIVEETAAERDPNQEELPLGEEGGEEGAPDVYGTGTTGPVTNALKDAAPKKKAAPKNKAAAKKRAK